MSGRLQSTTVLIWPHANVNRQVQHSLGSFAVQHFGIPVSTNHQRANLGSHITEITRRTFLRSHRGPRPSVFCCRSRQLSPRLFPPPSRTMSTHSPYVCSCDKKTLSNACQELLLNAVMQYSVLHHRPWASKGHSWRTDAK